MITWEYCRLEMKLDEGRGEQIVLYSYQPIAQSTQVVPLISQNYAQDDSFWSALSHTWNTTIHRLGTEGWEAFQVNTIVDETNDIISSTWFFKRPHDTDDND